MTADWIYLAQGKAQWRDLNFRVP